MKRTRSAGAVRCVLFAAAFLVVGTISSMAETVLQNIRISASNPAWEDGSFRIPQFTASGGYDMEVEWLTSESNYSPGDKVRARITLTAQDGYAFSDSPSIYVGGADVSSKSVSASHIVLQLRVGPLYYKLAAPEHVSWTSDKSSVVKWSKVEHATGYRVKVYQDNRVVRQDIVKTRTYDAGRYFNGDGELRISVAAVANDSPSRSYIQDSSEQFVDGNDVDWDDRDTTYGSWQGSRYRTSEDGDTAEYAKGWTIIFGKWYYFNQNGTLQTGWIKDGDKWYYSDKEGAMQTGWVKPEGGSTWYYCNSSGVMLTGWIQGEPGMWYYLRGDGAMHVGWMPDNGVWYFLGTDGKMLKGWQRINEQWYFFHDNGRMAKNETIGSYYVNADGIWR